jgi:hypothetical protein
MFARSPIKSSRLAVAAFVVASGCTPDEAAFVAPEPAPQPTTNPVPEPALDPPRQSRPPVSGELLRAVEVVGGRDNDDIGAVPTPVLRRLIYQCSDEVTFAVRIAGDRLEVIPPGVAQSYVVLTRMSVDSGVRFTAPNADFRAKDDLATLQIGRDRYVDCVSNPGAAFWGTVRPASAR